MEKEYTYTKEESKDKEITLTIKITPEKFQSVKTKVFNKLSQDVTIPGFRPGKAPKAVMEAHISGKVYDETVNELVPEVTAAVIEAEKCNPINQLHYEIVKMSEADGIEYKAVFVNYPQIKLGDFNKIKVKKEAKPVTEADVDKELQKIVNYYTKPAAKPAETGKEAPAQKAPDKDVKVEVTDEAVKALGIGIDTVAKLREQVKKELEMMSSRDAENKWLDAVVMEGIRSSRIEAPQALIKQSVANREQDYHKKLAELNLKLEEFLKVQNTTMEKLKEEWTRDSERKLAEELLLLEIIKAQQLTVTEPEITAEIAKVTDPKTKTDLGTPDGKRYLVTVLLQQKAVEWLKKQVRE
jgi:FKBP-type peptidyl-prolyl cis-trans isomerase (trigger factor)